jgi:uncharacterized membrane protein YeiB
MFVVLLGVFDYDRGWNWDTLEYSGFWTLEGFIRHLFFNGFHPVFPWTAFLLTGMVLGRQDMRMPRVRRLVLLWGLALTVVAAVLSAGLVRWLSWGASVTQLQEIQALFGMGPMPPMPLYMLSSAGTATAVIAVCISVTERFPDAPGLWPFISTGRLALTLYVAHVVVGMGLLGAIGRLKDQSPSFAMGSALTFCLLALLCAHWWCTRFARGPLEWAMRRISS